MIKTAIKMTAMAALFGIGATGCATTNVTTKVAGAPITYKIGKGEVRLTATELPGRPSLSIPTPQTRPAPRIATPKPVQPQGRVFDQSQVDRQLYKHQRVGTTYTVMGGTYTPRHDPDYDVKGTASWYGPKFHGKPTATGETFDKRDLTAAHKTLPLNSMLFVTNLENGRTLMVRLNDRGPFIGDRILDLSEASAEALGMKHQGKARVRVQYAGPADPMASQHTLPKRAPRPAPMPEANIAQAPAPAPIPFTPAPTPAPVQPAPEAYIPEFTQPSVPAPIAPSAPQRAPDADLPEGDITMIIKGQIHIAKSDATDQPRWIAERLNTK